MASLTVTFELLKLVPRRDSEIFQNGRRVEHPEFPKCNTLNLRPELFDGFAPKKALRVPVPEALDHIV